ncbi:MAG: xanthorhodopsin [Candidatus Limnocylindrus sp. ZSMar2m-chloro-G89]|nr:MAG: xanthorhodopsin [Candidatus Limnocylindrus sp.]RLT49515.1 MAG: xanthorhodopsin [Candidatus Limnocylindrus sp. ZSMar2m-chloro-G89]
MSPEMGYQLVYNFMSLAIAAMGASFFFFVSARGSLKEGNRMAVTLSATVVLIAFYHYVRIFDSWVATAGVGNPGAFNEGYRYVDWLLTVPLLVAELILVLRLDKKVESKLIQRNVLYAFLMIATGYIGELDVQTSVVLDSSRTIWGAISTIFFVLILRDLFGGIEASFKRQSKEIQGIFKVLRVVLIATWGVYPIAYLLPTISTSLGLTAGDGLVLKQIGYTIADILAKPGYGLLIWKIATLKNSGR